MQILQESQLALALTELVKMPLLLLNSRTGTGALPLRTADYLLTSTKGAVYLLNSTKGAVSLLASAKGAVYLLF